VQSNKRELLEDSIYENKDFNEIDIQDIAILGTIVDQNGTQICSGVLKDVAVNVVDTLGILSLKIKTDINTALNTLKLVQSSLYSTMTLLISSKQEKYEYKFSVSDFEIKDINVLEDMCLINMAGIYRKLQTSF
jgi:sialic acid synthase SpsE